jgi:DNA-binding cell septation regulator SpoVG
MTIKISEVQISFVKPNDGIIGFASLVVNDSIYLNSIAIHKKLSGAEYRITYPTKKLSFENSVNLFHPINRPTSLAIEQAIFAKLKEVMNKGNQNDRYSSYDLRNG